jgi:dihydrofolate reductase
MKAIVSADLNWAIGNDNSLLVRVPEDMKNFKSHTLGKVVIMGRKTFESLPGMQPLKNRINIVLTKNKNFAHDGVIAVHSVEEALKETLKYESEDVYIIGGAKIYKRFLPYCSQALVTRWDATFDADTYFPDLDEEQGWRLVEESGYKEHNELGYKFTVYENIMMQEIK